MTGKILAETGVNNFFNCSIIAICVIQLHLGLHKFYQSNL